MQSVFQNTLSMIGNTPLFELTQLDTGKCKLFVKLENQNPGGSIKDRIALSMIEAAEKTGQLKPGGTIVEATAGNTGIALGLVARLKGYNLKIVMPDKMSPEKIAHLRALGAEVIMTRSDVTKGHPEYYQDMAKRLAETMDNAFYIDQFNNPSNPLAHEQSTAPEIWEQMNHKVDAIVCGVGSGGTLSGIGRYFKKTSPSTEIIVADPKGSIIAELINTGKHTEVGSWLVEGIGEDFVPSICDISLASKGYYVSDQEAFQAAYDLLRLEGILGGSSTGTLLAGALKYCREQTTPKRVVTFVCDTGNKYLSKMYNAAWLKDKGIYID
jgi:cystathionine beta-synthase